jgi:hypothetical protein
MRHIPEKETLIVDFYKVDGGWLHFKLALGDQTFDSRFTEVFDPLPDFKHWLEAIAIGVWQTSFIFDTEGDEIRFDFNCNCRDIEILTIADSYSQGQVYIKSSVDRKQIIKAFYLGFLNFASSDKFKGDQWEVEFIKERLCKAFNLNENELIESLLDLGGKELATLLFHADPTYTISFPTAKDKKEEFALFYETDVRGNKVPEGHERLETPNEWKISDDYDFWQASKKKEYIINSINEKASGYKGTKINDFRSKIIEQYLKGGE